MQLRLARFLVLPEPHSCLTVAPPLVVLLVLVFRRSAGSGCLGVRRRPIREQGRRRRRRRLSRPDSVKLRAWQRIVGVRERRQVSQLVQLIQFAARPLLLPRAVTPCGERARRFRELRDVGGWGAFAAPSLSPSFRVIIRAAGGSTRSLLRTQRRARASSVAEGAPRRTRPRKRHVHVSGGGDDSGHVAY